MPMDICTPEETDAGDLYMWSYNPTCTICMCDRNNRGKGMNGLNWKILADPLGPCCPL